VVSTANIFQDPCRSCSVADKQLLIIKMDKNLCCLISVIKCYTVWSDMNKFSLYY